MTDIYEIRLKVNKVQKDQIEKILEDHNMKDVITDVKKLKTSQKRKQIRCTYVASSISESDQVTSATQLRGMRPGNGDDPHNEDEQHQQKCPICLMLPCVSIANSSAPWIGNGQEASVENGGIRKEIYKRFWKIMDNLGAWYIEEYLDRKRNIGGGDWVVYHRREIMPECVLDLARTKYPNPKDIPYIGHHWE